MYQTIDIDVEENEGVINTEMKQKLGETKKPIKIGKSIDPKDGDVDIDEKIHADNPYGDFYANEEPLLDVDISYLANIIEEKSKNENDGFKKEYAVCNFSSSENIVCVQCAHFEISSNHMYFIIHKCSLICKTMIIKHSTLKP